MPRELQTLIALVVFAPVWILLFRVARKCGLFRLAWWRLSKRVSFWLCCFTWPLLALVGWLVGRGNG